MERKNLQSARGFLFTYRRTNFDRNSTVMKKFFICTMLVLMTASSFCQQTDHSQSLTRQEYLQKCKNQKKAAWILLGSGITLGLAGPILWTSTGISDGLVDVMIVTGAASIAGSIPLFIAAGRNKKKGMNASTYFEIRQNSVPTNTGLGLHSTPTLSLKLNF